MRSGKKSKKIYIVLTYTGTVLSRIIKFYTGAEFSHVSLALDENLVKMYSFGRLSPYNPFIGGFVQEGVNIGTFGRFKNTKAEIYSFDLTSKQYKKLERTIKRIKRRRSLYKFNLIGMVATGFNIKIKRINHFYCAEFVKYLIDEAKIEVELPELVKPNDFKCIESLKLEYRGMLKNYKALG